MPISEVDTQGLSPADAALAKAITGVTLRRWLTLRFLLEKYLSKQLPRLEPSMQGILMTGAAQILFLRSLPDYAVVDEMVHVARRQVRPGAAGMTNAVLRQIARLRGEESTQAWVPSEDRLPLIDGGGSRPERLPADGPALPASLGLKRACLPIDDAAVLCNVPKVLWAAWVDRFGEAAAWDLAVHATQSPPVVIATEPQSPWGQHHTMEWTAPHAQEGFALWTGPSGSLGEFLEARPGCRVQDVTASKPVATIAGMDLHPARVLDYCAGRGTKTRQLRETFPDATLVATDVDDERRLALEDLSGVECRTPQAALKETYDLILLDVPCSNTGVLARRPEARFRYSQQSLGDLVQLQRHILAEVVPQLAPGGTLLYSTCSLDVAENQNQVARLTREPGFALQHEHLELPAGTARTYQDGGYHAVLINTHDA